MTGYVILGLVGTAMFLTAVFTLALCTAAKLGDRAQQTALDAERQERAASAELYPTTGRDVPWWVDPRVETLMRREGLQGDEAVARVLGGQE